MTTPIISITDENGVIQLFDLEAALGEYTAKSITHFAINGSQGIIDESEGTITVQLPHDTNLTSPRRSYSTQGQR